MTLEEIYSSVGYGKIMRIRGVQLWLGKDERGVYLDIHADLDSEIDAKEVKDDSPSPR